jgi:hypothetical protein
MRHGHQLNYQKNWHLVHQLMTIRNGVVLHLDLIVVGRGQHLDHDGQYSDLLKGLGSSFVVSQSAIFVSQVVPGEQLSELT